MLFVLSIGAVLTDEHLDALRGTFATVCARFGAELVEMDGADDHVHLLAAYPPQVAVAQSVNSLKGVSARRLRQRYGMRTHSEHLWSPSYFRRLGWRAAGDAQPYIRQQRAPGRPG